MKIEKAPYNKIKIIGANCGFIESQTVEANILYEILNTLKKLIITIEEHNQFKRGQKSKN